MDRLTNSLRLLATIVLVVLAVALIQFMTALIALAPHRSSDGPGTIAAPGEVWVLQPAPKRETAPQRIRVQRVSFYQAVPSQTDGDPEFSACGRTRQPWTQVAVSRDLFAELGCGTRVRLILDDGRVIDAVVWDTMAPRWRETVDVLVAPHEPAMAYGVRAGVLEVARQ